MNEILFMEIRMASTFQAHFSMHIKDVNQLFEQYGIWNYIEECYASLHVCSDDCALNDIVEILQAKGVQL